MVTAVLPGTNQDRPAGAAPTCPYCRSVLTDQGACPTCGIFCSRCGTPYREGYCPECHSPSSSRPSASSPEAPENTAFGEVAPDLRETRGIFGGRWLGRREWNMMRGTFATADGKQVHDRALEAVAHFDLSAKAQEMLLERVEMVTRRLLKRFRSVEKAVMFALAAEARNQGIPLVIVQNALGRAGFAIRFGSILVKVWTAKEGGDPAAEVKVNDQVRTVKAQASSGTEEDARVLLSFGKGNISSVRVPLLLTDSLSADAGEVALEFADGSEIVSYEHKFGARQTGKAALRLRLRPEKAFGLFKVKKQVMMSAPDQNPLAIATTTADPTPALDLYARRFLPSKFPGSAELMSRAGCLDTVERRFTELFRAQVKDANGKMPARMARRALYDADAEAFHLLPLVQKRVVRLLITGMRLSTADRRYTGVSGLLIPSEVGGRPT